jgi:hypothetical protein
MFSTSFGGSLRESRMGMHGLWIGAAGFIIGAFVLADRPDH